MMSLRLPRLFGSAPKDDDTSAPLGEPSAFSIFRRSADAGFGDGHDAETSSSLLKTIGLVTAGLSVLALGVVVGREIRQRYKFNRRTPYDFYAHAGDERDLEFGVGV